MLYLVLTLVIVAFGLLVAALTTANTVWAWVSVALSVVAAAVLVVDWVRGRRRVAATSAPRAADRAGERQAPDDTAARGPEPDFARRPPPEPPVEATTEIPALTPPVTPAIDEPPQERPAEAEPAEEATDAADLLVISELGVEVLVVDEHPRYHLAQCTWLTGKPTIPLPVSEARELGFTPCARCGPDAVLAARQRSSRGAKQ